jgi:hypothetical protein
VKSLPAIFTLALALTHASAAEVPATFVKLVGLSTVPEARCAFLLVLAANRPTLTEVVLSEGKSVGALELLALDDQTMTARIRNGGQESVVRFSAENPVPQPARARAGDSEKKMGAVRFQTLPVTQVLEFYAQLTGRTILRPSLLPVGVIQAQSQNLDREGIVRFLERTLTRAHLQILPQGEKFTVVLPENQPLPASAVWANRKTSPDKERSQATGVTKTGAIHFLNAELAPVLQLYENLSGRTIERATDLPNFPITFKTASALTDSEALYALDTVLGLHGIQVVAVDDHAAKAVPVTAAVNRPVPRLNTKTAVSK